VPKIAGRPVSLVVVAFIFISVGLINFYLRLRTPELFASRSLVDMARIVIGIGLLRSSAITYTCAQMMIFYDVFRCLVTALVLFTHILEAGPKLQVLLIVPAFWPSDLSLVVVASYACLNIGMFVALIRID